MANEICLGDVRGGVGARGANGAVPDIDVEINNLPAGSTPTVTIDKTGEHSVSNPLIIFGIPSMSSGTVVEFVVNAQKTGVSTTATFADIYTALQSRENVRFFLNVSAENLTYEMSYAIDESNDAIYMNLNHNLASCSFVWTADGISNFVYNENTIGNFTYTVVKTF